ncbi:hypothetical protein [Candidatus Pristimantibacillus sp. PTI5]|uniref:hypothetical protein n=1 Tax=Candidatus Pristimantibacillus sp. PTI5 TaxID=3400422 RepID=UPI003B024C30
MLYLIIALALAAAVIMAYGAKTRTAPVLQFSDNPDYPQPFGYKCQWMAVKTENTNEVAKHLNLMNMQPANWSTGIEGAYEGKFFVSPPVNGWTLVVNSLMPDITDTTEQNPLKVIAELSRVYGEACYFGTHRVVEYHAWAKALNGEISRAYSYVGESGETLVNQGALTAEELEHDLIFTELEEDELITPYEEDVLLIAKEWTTDPMMGQTSLELGVGLVGERE